MNGWISRKDYYNKKQLKERGWTETTIKKYLSDIEPVEFEGLYRDTPQKCYLKSIIEERENIPEFLVDKEKSKKRSEIGKLVATKKKEKNIEELKQHLSSINVRVVDDEKLIKNALQSKQNWYIDTEQYDRHDVYSADESTKKRWIVNYIRHHITKYDKYIDNMYRKVGVGELYNILHDYVLDLISEKYPKYKDECIRQKEYNRDNQ